MYRCLFVVVVCFLVSAFIEFAHAQAGDAPLGNSVGIQSASPRNTSPGIIGDNAVHKPTISRTPASQNFHHNQNLLFTENLGQVADTKGVPRPDILYYSGTGGGYRVYLSNRGMSYVFKQSNPIPDTNYSNPVEALEHAFRPQYRMDVNLLGANTSSEVSHDGQSTDYANFYFSHCPHGILNVHSYSTVTYANIYPHIDLVWRGGSARMEYQYIVHPGGNVSDIKMQYEGAEKILLTADGKVRSFNPFGHLDEEAPYSYQISDDEDVNVASKNINVVKPQTSPSIPVAFHKDGNVITFTAGDYDPRKTLIIDPTLDWCTFFGGAGTDACQGVATDTSANIDITGQANSINFPVTLGGWQTAIGGGYDAFVAQFDSVENLKWSTYYGGTNDEIEYRGIAVDGNNQIIITGKTSSGNFPVSAGAAQGVLQGTTNAYVVKFQPFGAMMWATYLGGKLVDGGMDVAADANNNILVTGFATSPNFPVTGGAFQGKLNGLLNAFVAKYTPTGALMWATYCGGSVSDSGLGVTADPTGNVIITGTTNSPNFPTTNGSFQAVNNGGYDAFVAKFTPNGNQVWATYYGGSSTDAGTAVACDFYGNVFFTGRTQSLNFPVIPTGYQPQNNGSYDAYIVKLSQAGSFIWSTYYGGSGEDEAHGITIDIQQNVLITGYTVSANFPVTNNYFQHNTSEVGFIVIFDNAGDSLIWATEIGGVDTKSWTVSNDIATDNVGSIIIDGATNAVAREFVPLKTPWQGTDNGRVSNGFIARFNSHVGDTAITCQGTPVLIGQTGQLASGLYHYSWSPTQGLSSTTTASTYATVDSATLYTETVSTSNGSSKFMYYVEVRQRPHLVLTSSYYICKNAGGLRIGGKSTGGAPPYTYQWNASATLDSLFIPQPFATPDTTTTYSVTVTDQFGCIDTGKVTVNVRPLPFAHAGPPESVCQGDSTQIGLSGSGGNPPYTYNWTPVSGISSSNVISPRVSPDVTTTYYVTVVDSTGCISDQDSVVVTVLPPPTLAVGDDFNTSICDGTSITIGGEATGAAPFTYQWSPPYGLDSTNVASPVASPTQTTFYNVLVTDANGCQNHGQVGIYIKPLPHPYITFSDSVVCAGDSATLTANDSNYISYLWSTGDSTQSIKVAKSGNYTVQVTGADGCEATSAVRTITVLPVPPIPKINGGDSAAICSGSSIKLTAPLGYANYAWSTGSHEPSIIVTDSGNYTVSITNANGCQSASLPYFVKVYPSPAPSITGPSAVCTNSTESYSVQDSNASGNNVSYAWSLSPNGTIMSGSGTNSVTINWQGAGTGAINVTETNTITGCTGTAPEINVNIGSSLHPQIASTGGTILCSGDSLPLDAGAGYVSYAWSTGATNEAIEAAQGGTYIVTVVDANGCQGSDTIQIIEMPTPAPVLHGPDSVCLNSVVTYAVKNVAGDVYDWTVLGGTLLNGSATNSITVQWGGTGTGFVSIIQSNSHCTGSASDSVVIGKGISPQIMASGPTGFCIGDSLKLTAPAGYSSYLWSDSETTQTIIVKNSGTYTVTVSDTDGCYGTSARLTVTAATSLNPVITPPGGFCPGDSLILDAGQGYATYHWNPTGDTTETIVVSDSGIFTVSVSNASGCTGTSTPDTVAIYPVPIAAIIQHGDTLTATPAAQYKWSENGFTLSGATQRNLVVTNSGKYTVTETNAQGCSSESNIYLVNEQPVNICASVEPPIMVPNQLELASIQLMDTVKLPLDSLVFDLHYDPTLLSFGTVLARSQCTFSWRTMQPGVISVNVNVCPDTIFPGPLVAAMLIPLVPPSGDTFQTTITVDSVKAYPGNLVASGVCSYILTILPLCDLGAIVYNEGATSLSQNRPNPFEATTTIHVTLTKSDAAGAQLRVYNMLGQRVADLTNQLTQNGDVTFAAGALNSGVYYYVLETSSGRLAREMLVVR